ncbi:hypothetical protein [Aestuariibacter sp. A3R04]|nr:hypothetical protein [Aestuariibacter sp. A3R04]
MIFSFCVSQKWEFIDRQTHRLYIDKFPVNKVITLQTVLQGGAMGVVNSN